MITTSNHVYQPSTGTSCRFRRIFIFILPLKNHDAQALCEMTSINDSLQFVYAAFNTLDTFIS